MEKYDLRSLYLSEIEEIIAKMEIQKYRAKQIFRWIYEGAENFEEMTDLSKELRNSLNSSFHLSKLEMINRQVSKDNTKKYLFRLDDGNTIESVLMQYEHGYSTCISTQVGCKMGCKFCASSGIGFNRNLTVGEIIGQVLKIQKVENIKVSNIVFMGIGEPMDNYDNVLKSLKLLNDANGLNIGHRHISVSTSGLVPQILKLAEEKLQITLSISLHAPNDEIRNQIMPISKKYNIKELIGACRKYIKMTGRRISFEYIMLKDVNDQREHAIELANLLKGMIAHVNLIPYNEVPNVKWKKSPKENITKFINELEKNNINVTVRRSLGTDITAACGQLRKNEQR